MYCFQAGINEAVLCWKSSSCIFLSIHDIFVYSPDESLHLIHLEQVLKDLDGLWVKLNAHKCVSYSTEIKWCGQMIDAEGNVTTLICPANCAVAHSWWCGRASGASEHYQLNGEWNSSICHVVWSKDHCMIPWKSSMLQENLKKQIERTTILRVENCKRSHYKPGKYMFNQNEVSDLYVCRCSKPHGSSVIAQISHDFECTRWLSKPGGGIAFAASLCGFQGHDLFVQRLLDLIEIERAGHLCLNPKSKSVMLWE